MQNAVTDGLSSVATFVPRLALFLVIVLVGWFVAKAVGKIVNRVLERVGFDRAIERGGVGAVMARSQYDPSDVLAKLAYYAVLLFTLQLAFGVFGPNPISELITSVIAFLPKLFVAIVIVIVAAAIAKAVKELIQNTLGGLSYASVLGTIASVFIMGLGVIAALNQVGVATTVTTPVLVTVLATIGGILVVGVGGGLVRPMQSRWSRWLETAEQETSNIKAAAETSPSVKDQARMAKARYDAAPVQTSDQSAHVDLTEDDTRTAPLPQSDQFRY